jgi:2-keto-4-pentenoate hydratase/2-oxohepta-3-ene-1,7-dioic acid hydratase in catechol pathway
MVRVARSADGTALIGDEDGFVPASAVDEQFSNVRDVLTADPADIPDLDTVPESRSSTDTIQFGVPLGDVGKLWGIGLNYVDHADDLDAEHPDQPASFMKPSTAVTGPGGPIRLPPKELTSRVTAEAELGVVIGRRCKDLEPSTVQDAIAGYVPVIDVTAEDILQRNPRFLTRSKSFDTFLVIGPWITSADEFDRLGETTVTTRIDGETVGENVVSNMRFSPAELVAYHSRIMTLEPGDLISTGTPGAGRIRPGDRVHAEVDGLGTLEATVVGPNPD